MVFLISLSCGFHVLLPTHVFDTLNSFFEFLFLYSVLQWEFPQSSVLSPCLIAFHIVFFSNFTRIVFFQQFYPCP